VTLQPPIPRAAAVLVAALLAALVAVSFAPRASAAPPCAQAILADWLENDRIDRVYALPCYEAAIDAIPQDLEDYTNAADVIARAFQRVSGRRLERTPQGPVVPSAPEETPTVDTSSSTSLPVPIIVLGGMSAVLLGAGGLGYLSRRRREGSELGD
jgi:hypothetical protein